MESKEIIINAFKHNGKLHRTWFRTYLVDDNDSFTVVGSTHSLVIESDGRRWHAIEPAVSIFMKKEWFNIVAMMKPDGIYYYVNIASPSIFNNDVIEYIDYDVDFKIDPMFEYKTLDEFEYKKHKKKYNYSEELDEVIKYAIKKVKDRIINNEFPFTHEIIEAYYKEYLK